MTTSTAGAEPAPLQVKAEETRAGHGFGFRPDIEGIRALAVLMVALNHAGVPGFPGGYVGVDVFFVISGFLITSLLLRDMAGRGLSIASFYARRIRRILPLSALVTLVVLAYAWPIYGSGRASDIATDGFWTGLFSGNWHFMVAGIDYFNRGASTSPLEHYWSLGVEEQFYFVWPALLVVAATFVTGHQPRRRFILAALGTACVASLVWSIVQTRSAPELAYFSTLTRAWELGAGAGLATLLHLHPPKVFTRLPNLTTGVGLAMVIAAMALYDESTPFPGYAALLPVVGALLMIAGGETESDARAFLAARPMQFIGTRSYGFYLWHLPVLVMTGTALGGELAWGWNVLLLLAAFGVACLTYTFVEHPTRTSALLRSRSPWVSIGVGIGLVAVVVAASLGLRSWLGSDGDDAAAVSYADLPGESEIAALVAEGARLTTIPDALTPAAGRAKDGLMDIATKCEFGFDVSAGNYDCVLGDPKGTKTMVLLGDSHAQVWVASLDLLARAKGWRLIVLAKPGCAPLMGLTEWHPTEDRPYDTCPPFVKWAVDEINADRPEFVVLTGAYRNFHWAEDGEKAGEGTWTGGNGWTGTPEQVDKWDEGLAGTLDALAPSGARLVVIGDTSYARTNDDCVWRNRNDLSACNGTPADQFDFAHQDGERKVVESHDATFVATDDWFCTDEDCPGVIGNHQVYTDSYHVTGHYARFLARAFAQRSGLE